MRSPQIRPLMLALSVAAALAAPAAIAENVKVAFIDTLSGPFAPVGNFELKAYQYSAELARQQNWGGGNTLEFVPFDGRGSPQESLRQL
jgi:branched-chain amino acid transport system substrate-binding protein